MAVSLTDNHFELLGVNRQASQKEIKNAYRLQMSLWHPDKFHNDGSKRVLAEERSKSINEAYELLKSYVPNNYFTQQVSSKSGYQRTERKYRTSPLNEIEKVLVDSASVLAIGYLNEEKTLVVDFANGSRYEYYSVPIATYHAFLKATSKGKFVHANLRSFKYAML